jgi:HD-GYP domain-containing protein (c-di-GMP phosphodiesterase class II)
MSQDDRTKLKRLLLLGNDLNKIHDPDALMERILKEAREFCTADAGSIYITSGNHLQISYTQNDSLKENKVVYKEYSIPINDFSIAGHCANKGTTVLLNDVRNIASDIPFTFNSDFDEITGYNTKSVLSIPMKGNKGRVIGVLQIINPMDENNNPRLFTGEDTDTLMHFAGIAAVALQKAQLTKSIILKMIQMAELHDPSETGAHVHRVAAYSTELYIAWAEKNRVDHRAIEKNKDVLKLASMVHDIGKVAISDLILKKPGPLSEDEYTMMKMHTIYGARMFEDQLSDFETAASQVALNHHERWDGKGYPGYVDINTGKPLKGYRLSNGQAKGKKGEEIPIFGRIVTVADVFDALSSKRCYKDAWSSEDVSGFLKKNSGTQFDPFLIDIFLDNIETMNSIRAKYQ